MPIDWKQKSSDAGALAYDERHLPLAQSLDDYEILFPETRNVRLQLITRVGEINTALTELSVDLLFDNSRPKAIENSSHIKELTWDFVALLEDLRIHLQNTTLSKITGNQVPSREPLDKTLPTIIMGRDGNLQIVNGEPPVSSVDL